MDAPANFATLAELLYSFFKDKYGYDVTQNISEKDFKQYLTESMAIVQSDKSLSDLSSMNKAVMALCTRKIKHRMTVGATSAGATESSFGDRLTQLEQARQMTVHPETIKSNALNTVPHLQLNQNNAYIQMPQTINTVIMPQKITKSSVTVIESRNRAWDMPRNTVVWNGAPLEKVARSASIRVAYLTLPACFSIRPFMYVCIQGQECVLMKVDETKDHACYKPLTETSSYIPYFSLPWNIQLKDSFHHLLDMGMDGFRVTSMSFIDPLLQSSEYVACVGQLFDFEIHHAATPGTFAFAVNDYIAVLSEKKEIVYGTVHMVLSSSSMVVTCPYVQHPQSLMNISKQWTLMIEHFAT